MRYLRISYIVAIICGVFACTVQCTSPAGAREVISLTDGTQIQLEEFRGASVWSLVNHYFTSSAVVIRCPDRSDFKVLTGRTVADIRGGYARKESAWCGWDRFLGRASDTCVTPISPLGPTVVAIVKPKSWFSGLAGLRGSNHPSSATACTMERVQEFSTVRFLTTALGAFFFYAAPQLSESTPFRLAGGSLTFAALSGVVLLFLLYRSVPYKRSLFVTAAVLGSTLAGFVRSIYGAWLPSLGQLAQSPLVLGYILLSGLVGLAVTYYYNDASNAKVNTMLRVALQLSGLGMVMGSASSWPGAALGLAVLLGAKIAPLVTQERDLFQALRRIRASVKEDLQESIPEAEFPTGWYWRLRSLQSPSCHQVHTHAGRVARAADQEATTPGVTTTPARIGQAAVSPLVQRGLVLNLETGKTIQIGKATYNRLMVAGYELDEAAGTLTPPGGFKSGGLSKASPASTGRRSSTAGRSGSSSRRRSRSRSSTGR